jgi:hypothetical protein
MIHLGWFSAGKKRESIRVYSRRVYQKGGRAARSVTPRGRSRRVALGGFRLAGPDGFCAYQAREIFQLTFVVAVHQDQQRIRILVLDDQDLDDLVFVDPSKEVAKVSEVGCFGTISAFCRRADLLYRGVHWRQIILLIFGHVHLLPVAALDVRANLSGRLTLLGLLVGVKRFFLADVAARAMASHETV